MADGVAGDEPTFDIDDVFSLYSNFIKSANSGSGSHLYNPRHVTGKRQRTDSKISLGSQISLASSMVLAASVAPRRGDECNENLELTATAIDASTVDKQPRNASKLSTTPLSSRTSMTDARTTLNHTNTEDVDMFNETERYLSNAFRPKIAALVGEEDYRRFIEELEWQWEHDALTLVERSRDLQTTSSAAKRADALQSGLRNNRALVAVLRGIREEAEAFMTVRTLEEHERKVAILRRRNAARRHSNVVDRTHRDSIKDRLLETVKGTFKRADTARDGWHAHGFYSFRGQHRNSGSSRQSLVDVIVRAEVKVMHIMRDAEDFKGSSRRREL